MAGETFIDDDGKVKVRVFVDGGETSGFTIAGDTLTDGSVTTAKLADKSVTDAKLDNPKVNKSGDTMSGRLEVVIPTQDVQLGIAMYTTGQGHSNAPKTLDKKSAYIALGGLEYGANSYRLIGCGYHWASANSFPVMFGYESTNETGNTMGDFIVATRSVTSDTNPAVRLRVTASGQVVIEDAAYVPGSDKAIPNKKYVDALIADVTTQFSSLTAADLQVLPSDGVPIGTIQNALQVAVTQFLSLSERVTSLEARAIPKIFTSTVQTGNGNAQNIAHGLGALPKGVLIIPVQMTFVLAGAYEATEGTHTTTNVVVDVTSGAQYKVMAWT